MNAAADELLGRWQAAARGAGVTADEATLRAVGEDLIHRWNEPHRHYHTVAHLSSVLDHVDSGAAVAARADLVRLAAWWHDAVYDPQAGVDANERASAELAADTLARLGAPPVACAETARLVLLTAGHAAAPGDRDGGLLCDADLAVLAAPPDEYDAYASAVRREYAHVPEAAFRIGRADVLKRLRALPALYRLAHLPDSERQVWERRARANLGRELARLACSVTGPDPGPTTAA